MWVDRTPSSELQNYRSAGPLCLSIMHVFSLIDIVVITLNPAVGSEQSKMVAMVVVVVHANDQPSIALGV